MSCQHPAQSDESKNLGECPNCSFAFCLQCQKAYHGANPCHDPEELLEEELLEEEEVDDGIERLPDSKDLRELDYIIKKQGARSAIKHLNYLISLFMDKEVIQFSFIKIQNNNTI